MFAPRAIAGQALRLSRWTQFRSVSTLEGSPYIVCDFLQIQLQHIDTNAWVVCFPQ